MVVNTWLYFWVCINIYWFLCLFVCQYHVLKMISLVFLDYDIITPFPSPPYFLQTLSFTPPCCLLNSPWFLESSSRLWYLVGMREHLAETSNPREKSLGSWLRGINQRMPGGRTGSSLWGVYSIYCHILMDPEARS